MVRPSPVRIEVTFTGADGGRGRAAMSSSKYAETRDVPASSDASETTVTTRPDASAAIAGCAPLAMRNSGLDNLPSRVTRTVPSHAGGVDNQFVPAKPAPYEWAITYVEPSHVTSLCTGPIQSATRTD